MKIDCHVHVLPDFLGRYLGELPYQSLRRQARSLFRPLVDSLHRSQLLLRHAPLPVRQGLDQLTALTPLPHLLLESTPADLLETMDEAGVDRAVLVAHPPFSSNEFILETCQENPRFIPAVNVPPAAARPAHQLKKWAEQGAKLLKIHAAADGEGVDSPRYLALLKAAADLGLPVILHSGCIHSNLLYKDPEQAKVERFLSWFEEFKPVSFILAHMNFHEPTIALDLAEGHPNLFVDVSWQPAESIGEAVRRLGAERVLFGTDWPLVGHNMEVGLQRVRDCVDSGFVSEEQAALILGENAAKLLKMPSAEIS